MEKSEQSPVGAFRINMQIIADALEENNISIQFQKGNDSGRLIGVRMCYGQTDFDMEYVYLSHTASLPVIPPETDSSFLVLGSVPAAWQGTHISIIELDSKEDLFCIFDFIQDVFKKNRKWDESLQCALNHDMGISELCKVSVDYFNNPLFIHDTQFYLIECPVHVPEMPKWVWNERTQMYMVPPDIINEFKVDPEYISSLDTKGAQMFSDNLRGYRILYVNIWDELGRYKGRLCIDELFSPLKPGNYLAAEHLVNVIKIAMRRRSLSEGSMLRSFEHVLDGILDRTITDPQSISNEIATIGWKTDDRYVCIKMDHGKHKLDNMAMKSACNHIESEIMGSYAYRHNDTIVMILNLTVNGTDCSSCLTKLAYIIREGLFKAGVSNVYQDFSQTHYYYRQAELALKYGKKNDSTLWCHRFETYVLNYMRDCCCSDFPSKLLCAEGLHAIRHYDHVNITEFYKTLKIYLKNDRRATQTAKELYIHRSTLFYRLERIEKLLQVDLDDPYKRLYISLCIYLLEQEKQ